MAAGAIEPGLIVLAGHLDDQRVALPATHRLAHPRVGLGRPDVLQVDVADSAGELVGDEDVVLVLEDLEREGHVGGAGDARHVALDLRVAVDPVDLVLFLPRTRLRRVRDPPATFDYAQASGHRADRPEPQYRCVRQQAARTLSKLHRGSGNVRLDIVVRRVQHLPDAVQVRVAVRQPGRLEVRRLCGGRTHRQDADPGQHDRRAGYRLRRLQHHGLCSSSIADDCAAPPIAGRASSGH